MKESDMLEFFGGMIDVFEDFLDYKDVDIPNDEKLECDDPESCAKVYGSDFDWLYDQLYDYVHVWGLV